MGAVSVKDSVWCAERVEPCVKCFLDISDCFLEILAFIFRFLCVFKNEINENAQKSTSPEMTFWGSKNRAFITF